MRSKKIWFSVLLAFCLALAAVACGDKTPSGTDPETPETPETPQTPVYTVAFDGEAGPLIVGGTAALHATVSKDGQPTDESVVYKSSDNAVVTVDADTGVAQAVSTGTVTITARHTMSGVSAYLELDVYTPVRTAEEFDDIRNDMDGKYLLMNDIDFGGTVFRPLSSYKSVAAGTSEAFEGIFDGNGFTLSGISPGGHGAADDRDYSVFGYIGESGVIRNVSVTGAVISSRAGVAASFNLGRIENVFVQASVTGTINADTNNPIGILVIKNQGVVRDCAVDVTVADSVNTDLVAALIGIDGAQSPVRTMTRNCYALSDTPIPVSITRVLRSPTTAVFTDEASFTEEILTGYGDAWQTSAGTLPRLKKAFGVYESGQPAGETYFYGQTYTFTTEPAGAFTVEAVSGDDLIQIQTGTDSFTVGTVGLGQAVIRVTDERGYTVLLSMYIGLPNVTATVDDVTLYLDMRGESLGSASLSYEIFEADTPTDEYDGLVTFGLQEGACAAVTGDTIVPTASGEGTVTLYIGGTAYATARVTVYKKLTEAADFDRIREDLAGYYAITSDIDFGGGAVHAISSYTGGTFFDGVFEGNGYALKNLELRGDVVNGSEDVNYGLFGRLNGTVRNLCVENAAASGRAAIVAMNYGRIENCYVELHVTGVTNASTTLGIAPFVVRNYGIVTDCAAEITVDESLATTYIFGTVAMNYAAGTVTDAVTVCASPIAATEAHAQGTGTVSACHVVTSAEEITEAMVVGFGDAWQTSAGMLPRLKKAFDVYESGQPAGETYFYGQTYTFTTEPAGAFTVEAVSGSDLVQIQTGTGSFTVGTVGLGQAVIRVTDERGYTVLLSMYIGLPNVTATVDDVTLYLDMRGESLGSASLSYEIFEADTPTDEYDGLVTFGLQEGACAAVTGDTIVPTASGEGTVTLYIGGTAYATARVTVYKKLTEAADFDRIREDLAGYYAITSDIDFGGGAVHAISSYTGGTFFDGVFEGNGYALKNLELRGDVVNGSEDVNYGLFGRLNGTVRNLCVENAAASGRAAIVAMNYGRIENCYVELHVTGVTNASTTLGIAPFVVRNYGIVTDCAAEITVDESLATTYIFGTVAMNYAAGTVTDAVTVCASPIAATEAHAQGTGVVSACHVVASAEEITEEMVVGFGDAWQTAAGTMPVLKAKA